MNTYWLESMGFLSDSCWQGVGLGAATAITTTGPYSSLSDPADGLDGDFGASSEGC
jgi:hypothetical protein